MFHTNNFPERHGICVFLSGRLPSQRVIITIVYYVYLDSFCFVIVSDECRWQCRHILSHNFWPLHEFDLLICRVCWLFREAAYNELKSLQSDSWIDERRTRAVITEFTLFHTQSTLFSSVKLALEISPLGRVTTLIQLASVFLYKYTSTVDYVVLVSEVFVLIFLWCLTPVSFVNSNEREILH